MISLSIQWQGELAEKILINNLSGTQANEDEMFDMLIQVVKALSFMHEGLRMCHRDVKPQNIMYDMNGVVKLVDLGSTKKMRK